MIVFRLARSQYADDLSGKGAELYGGRWNSVGKRLIYTSASRALCTVEIAANLPLGLLPKDYKLITIQFPDKVIEELSTSLYPIKWDSFPHTDATQKIGNQFILDAEHLVLKVESALVQDEYNYLINPLHKDFKYVKIKKIEDYGFNERLLK